MSSSDSKTKHLNFFSGKLSKDKKWKWRDIFGKPSQNQTGEETVPHISLKSTHLYHM